MAGEALARVGKVGAGQLADALQAIEQAVAVQVQLLHHPVLTSITPS